jgi:general secretion pathway protein G
MKIKKRALTLLEIIIVIFLITLITGAIGYNMKGALDKGRAFRTQQAKEQLSNLLLICLEEGEKVENLVKNPAEGLRKYNLAKDPDKLVLDGWGQSFEVKFLKGKREFDVISREYNKYNNKLDKKIIEEVDEED